MMPEHEVRIVREDGFTSVGGIRVHYEAWGAGDPVVLVHGHGATAAAWRPVAPTLAAAGGEPDIVGKMKKGYKSGKKTFKVHLDGYDLTDYLAGTGPDPRREFIYFVDDGSLVGLRYDQWKIVFAEQRAEGLDVWQEPFVPLRLPKLFNLRSDPFETADHEAMDYERWRVEHLFVVVPAQAYVARFLETFKEFPPRQKPGSFSIDQVMERMQLAASGGAN